MDKSYLLSAIPPLISVTLAVTFFFLWRRKKESRHVLNWSFAYGSAAIGATVDFARVLVENAAFISFLANIFLLGLPFFVVRGIALRYANKQLDWLLVPIYASAVAGGLWFGFVDPSILGRGTASSLAGAAMFLIGAGTILRTNEIDSLDRLAVAIFVLTSAALTLRPLVSYIYEGPILTEAAVAGSLWIVSFKVLSLLSWFATAILFLLRITSDLMKEVSIQSITDPLTGISNRRGFFAVAEALVRDASPALPASLLLLDIDHFKRVNDTFGHAAGDRVIKALATLLREIAQRSGSAAGRMGGEEFVALLPATNLVSGRAFAEELRAAFADCCHEGIPSSHKITASIGLAETLGGEGLDSVIERADGALYRAKREGRNRVHVSAAEGKVWPDSASQGPVAKPDRRTPRSSLTDDVRA